MQRFTCASIRRLDIRRVMQAVALGVLLAVPGGRDAQARTTGTLTATVPDGADLTVTKTALSDLVAPDEVLIYEISVTNNGLGTAKNVTLDDFLPE